MKYRPILFTLLMITMISTGEPIAINNQSHLNSRLLPQEQVEYEFIMTELIALQSTVPIYGDDSVVWGGDLGPYYNSSEVKAKLQSAAAAFPEIATYFEYGQSTQNNSLVGIKLTLPIKSVIQVKYETVLIGAHHAREAITVLDTLLFMDRLLFDYTRGQEWAINLLTLSEIYIIPIFNPDGVDYLSTNPWQRKNMALIDDDGDGNADEYEVGDANGDGYVAEFFNGNRYFLEGVDLDGDGSIGEDNPGGVDLNRNYGYEFEGAGSSTDPHSDVYRGTTPFSEPETSAYRDFALNKHFYTSLSLHSGIQAIIYPWGYTSIPPPDYDTFINMTNDMKALTGFPSWEDVGGYGVNGEWGDYMYGALDSMAFTIETYYDNNAWVNVAGGSAGIWDYFNPGAYDIFDVSMNGVQPLIDYLVTTPMTNTTLAWEFNITTIEANLLNDYLIIDWQGDIKGPNIFTSIEVFNETDFSWNTISRENISGLTSGVIDAFISNTDLGTWRMYVGTQSQGRSYYIDISNGSISSDVSYSIPEVVTPDYNEVISYPTDPVTITISTISNSTSSTNTESSSITTTTTSQLSSQTSSSKEDTTQSIISQSSSTTSTSNTSNTPFPVQMVLVVFMAVWVRSKYKRIKKN